MANCHVAWQDRCCVSQLGNSTSAGHATSQLALAMCFSYKRLRVYCQKQCTLYFAWQYRQQMQAARTTNKNFPLAHDQNSFTQGP